MKHNFPKLLFINPPGSFTNPVLPLGMALIAAYLKSKEKNINISVLDAWAEKINFEELKNKVLEIKPDIIGIFMVSPRYDETKKTIEICRQSLPKAAIIAGGPHPSAMPEETLKDIPQLDVCAIGEGEITMHEFVNAVKNNIDLSRVDGLAYRDKKTDKIIITKPREFIKDLDGLPWPARELFPLNRYKVQPPMGRKNPYFSLITSRGCSYQCVFCSKAVFQNIYRARSAQNVVDEIEYLINKYGAKEIQFYDDDFSMNIKRAEAICDEIIKRNLKIRWGCSTRVDQVSENLLKKMKEAGCWCVMYGVESGNQKILDSINKRFTIEQIIKAFKMAKDAGLLTFCSVIYGLPGETKESLEETFELVKKIKPNFFSGGHLRVLPGSRIFDLIKSGNYPGKTRDLKRNESLVLGFFNRGNYTVLEDNLNFEEIKEIAQRNVRRFYLRPEYLWQSLTTIRSFEDLKYYAVGGFEILKLALNK